MSQTKIRLVVLAAICFLFSAVQGQEDIENDYKIYSVKDGREVSLSEMVSSLAETDVLFFGEEHDDSLGHWLQDTIYAQMVQQYQNVALSMEMFETDCQLVLDEYLAGFITEDKFIKDARAWKNYKEAYRPLVERAKTQGLPVIAANAPRRYVSMVSAGGKEALEGLPKSSRQYLPKLPIYTADSSYYHRFHETMNQFGHGVSDEVFFAQCTWDASMAYQVYQHWRKNKGELIFHLNGRFHTDYQQGTIAQLRRLNTKINIQNISCFKAEDFEAPDWEEYKSQGDFIIISAP
ncbi:MAG: ChaN family lipoprotein [Bacteroidota bacterium]